MQSKGFILEGISGAGKSSLLKALLESEEFASVWPRYDVFREKETFGEFMGELAENPAASDAWKLRLLTRTTDTASRRAHAEESYRFIMERGPSSYYALLPRWELYAEVDARLAAIGATVVLLDLPDSELKARTLERADRNWAEGFKKLHGSEEQALRAFSEVQRLRREAVERSALPRLVIDTTSMDWPAYVSQIARYYSTSS